MEPNQMNNQMNQPAPMPENKTSTGTMIASIIILLIIILGGVYFFKNIKNTEESMDTTAQEQAQAESSTNAYVQSQSSQNSSDDVTSIETDINATNIDSVDQGL
jgi:uncharacterized protein HemX